MNKTLAQAWKTSEVHAAYVEVAGFRIVLVSTINGYKGFIQWNVDGKWKSIKNHQAEKLSTLLRILRCNEEEFVPYAFLPVWKPLQSKEW